MPAIGALFAFNVVREDPRIALGSVAVAVALLIAAMIAVLAAWIQWMRFTFHVEGGALRAEEGIIVRKSTRLTPERIQSIDTKANLLFRVLGLVTVDIQTAGRGKEAEVSIPALTESDARELAAGLRVRHERLVSELGAEAVVDIAVMPEPQAPTTSHVWTLTTAELAVVALTSSGGLIVLAAIVPVVGALMPVVSEELPVELADALTLGPWIVILGILAVAMVGVAWIAGSVGTALQYWEFVTKRTDDELRVERGLLQRNTRSVPLDRVQAIRLVEGPLRQMIRRVTVGVDSAGLATGGEFGPTVLHPLLTAQESRRFCDLMVPGHMFPELRRVPKRARRRYVIRAIALPMLVAGVLAATMQYGWLALSIPILSSGWGLLAFTDAAWGISGDVVALRWRTFARTTALVRRRRVQSVTVSQHPLQKIAGLASVSVRVAASPMTAVFQVRHLDERDAIGIVEWVSEGVERTEKWTSVTV